MGREGKGRKGTRSDGKGRAKVQPPLLKFHKYSPGVDSQTLLGLSLKVIKMTLFLSSIWAIYDFLLV